VSNRFDAVHRAEPVEVRWLFRIYNGLVVLAVPVILLFIALRWRRRFFSKGFDRWSQRWGHLPEEQLIRIRAKGPWWWVHAVSLGEVKAIETFLRKAPTHARAQILLSVVTPEAIAYAVENKVAQEIIAAPIDLPWVVRRVFADFYFGRVRILAQPAAGSQTFRSPGRSDQRAPVRAFLQILFPCALDHAGALGLL